MVGDNSGMESPGPLSRLDISGELRGGDKNVIPSFTSQQGALSVTVGGRVSLPEMGAPAVPMAGVKALFPFWTHHSPCCPDRPQLTCTQQFLLTPYSTAGPVLNTMLVFHRVAGPG